MQALRLSLEEEQARQKREAEAKAKAAAEKAVAEKAGEQKESPTTSSMDVDMTYVRTPLCLRSASHTDARKDDAAALQQAIALSMGGAAPPPASGSAAPSVTVEVNMDDLNEEEQMRLAMELSLQQEKIVRVLPSL